MTLTDLLPEDVARTRCTSVRRVGVEAGLTLYRIRKRP